MLKFLASGDWPRGRVRLSWTPSTRRILPDVEQIIETAWSDAARRLGSKLFDGPMCRLERFAASDDSLELFISPTSYKPFLGTNLTHAHDITDRFGIEALANPIGLSSALQTCDGWLLLGRRNDSVAYYPNRVHPFAGALEPREPLDAFDEIRRELREELSFESSDISDIRCIGIAEDVALLQPELIFHVTSSRTRAATEAMLDEGEHHATYPISATADAVDAAIRDPSLTPIAVATLALWGRKNMGNAWFSRLTLPPQI